MSGAQLRSSFDMLSGILIQLGAELAPPLCALEAVEVVAPDFFNSLLVERI